MRLSRFYLAIGSWTLLVVLAGTLAAQGQWVTIASWNLKNLGANTDVIARAEVIGKFDLVALQEIDSLQGLNKLLVRVEAITGVDWDTVVSPKVGEGNAAEYYAFIYRTDVVTYIQTSSGVYPESATDDFSREPFFATFRSGEFDFTLITVHITWGASASLRTAECLRLQSVWNTVQNMDSEEDDLILLGDFNRDKPTHSAFDVLEDMGIKAVVTLSGTRTTFGQTASGGSWYDHIWIDPRYTGAELTDAVGTGSPDGNTSGSGCSQTLGGISDHCPVWAVFDTAHDDDPIVSSAD